MNAPVNTSTQDAPAIVHEILSTTVRRGCTDLYVLPRHECTHIRARMPSGELIEFDSLEPSVATQVTARIKVLAGMLTYRTSIPQDGVIRNLPECGSAEFRVASLPTETGERLTVRILHAIAGPRTLADLGFPEETVTRLRQLLHRPSGLIVLTGPTGSGKTTTIYAMIRELLKTQHNPATIITIEDPVECLIPGVSQVQLRRENPDWGYAQALKAALRHDVKTLIIGELRDSDITKIALDAALTGHRIITTYHAGDIAGVYARLLHQGAEPFLISAAVQGVVAQRLITSSHCPRPVPVAAILDADDKWREFVMGAPGLRDLRARLRDIPGADLEVRAKECVKTGRITAKEACLI